MQRIPSSQAETPLLLPDEMSKGAAEAGWPIEDIADEVCVGVWIPAKVMICMTASVVREGKVQFTTDTLRHSAESCIVHNTRSRPKMFRSLAREALEARAVQSREQNASAIS